MYHQNKPRNRRSSKILSSSSNWIRNHVISKTISLKLSFSIPGNIKPIKSSTNAKTRCSTMPLLTPPGNSVNLMNKLPPTSDMTKNCTSGTTMLPYKPYHLKPGLSGIRGTKRYYWWYTRNKSVPTTINHSLLINHAYRLNN